MIDKNVLWVEKYRPHTVQECILPETLKATFQAYVDEKKFPNLMLSGTAGTGKTTVAKALCEETDFNYIMLNASDDNGIDTLRIKVKGFASSISLYGVRKAVIMDEADGLTPAAQQAFRGVINDHSRNCCFIFTCNYKTRIIEPLHSRFAVIDFKLQNGQKPKMAMAFLKRVEGILKAEGVTYDKEVVIQLITKFFPDYRRILNELQRHSSSGTIDANIISQVSDSKLTELFAAMKVKNYNALRKWVALNSDTDTSQIFSTIYARVNDLFKPDSVPIAVVLLSKYQYQAPRCSDQEINLMACLTQIYVECEML